MNELPHEGFALLALVFVLGLRHGMDPDHLATVDGLTRFNSVFRPGLARWCGFLFSLGHGAVVTVIAVTVGVLAKRWMVPHWLDDLGNWISILFLLALGVLNLLAVLRAQEGQLVQPIGLKGAWFGRFSRNSRPALIALVGALFALSFDTMSQAAVFSLAAASLGGWALSLLLGLVFMAGMMVTDGVNGLWIWRVIRRADQRAVVASRVMGLVVAGLSFAVGGYGLARCLFPAVAAAGAGQGLMLGWGVIFIVAASFLLAMRLSGRRGYAR